jgi:hypothetical protein
VGVIRPSPAEDATELRAAPPAAFASTLEQRPGAVPGLGSGSTRARIVYTLDLLVMVTDVLVRPHGVWDRLTAIEGQ